MEHQLSTEATIFAILFAIDEMLPYLPIKGNNYIQVLQGILRALKPLRREDEAVAELRQEVLELQAQLKTLKRSQPRTPRTPTTRGR